MKNYEEHGSLNKRDLSLDFKNAQGTDYIYHRIPKKTSRGCGDFSLIPMRGSYERVGHRGIDDVEAWHSLRVKGAEFSTFSGLRL